MSHLIQAASTGGNTGPSVQPQAAANLAPGPSIVPEVVWLPFIRDVYPNLHGQTYFLPPLHFSPVPHSVHTIAGQTVRVLEQPPPPANRRRSRRHPPHPTPQVAGTVFTDNPPGLEPQQRLQDSDLQDDQAQKHVLQCLRALSENSQQVMMVISQLMFRKYLDNIRSPIDAAVIASLLNLTPLPDNLADGECDILIILRHYGFLIGEIKSVGGSQFFANNTLAEQHRMIVGTVEKAVTQLNNQGMALGQLVSDMPPLKVTKVIILPNITSSQMLQAFNTDPAVSQALCQCLNAQDLPKAVSRCLCADQMPTTEDLHVVSSTVTSQLSAWWQHAVLDAGPDPSITHDLYERLLARFCGPATTVDIPTVTPPRKAVRSEAQAVAETGLTVSSLALYPDQVHLLNRHLPRVFLWGPPGTGKTVILVLKALQLLNQHLDTHLVSISTDSFAVTTQMEQQIRHSLGAAPASGTLHRHHFDFEDNPGEVTAAVNKLVTLSVSRDAPLYIVMDEVAEFVRSEFTEFCRQLDALVPNVSVWAAGVYCHHPLPPAGMYVEKLTVPLRSFSGETSEEVGEH